VLYTDALSPQEARDKGCRTIEGAPITIIQGRAPGNRPGGAGHGRRLIDGAPGRGRVDPAAQRARDSDARRILARNCSKEEERLAETAEGIQQRRARAPRRRAQLPALPGARGRDEGRHHAQGSRHRGAEARTRQAAA
jgi:hypothetical protein